MVKLLKITVASFKESQKILLTIKDIGFRKIILRIRYELLLILYSIFPKAFYTNFFCKINEKLVWKNIDFDNRKFGRKILLQSEFKDIKNIKFKFLNEEKVLITPNKLE